MGTSEARRLGALARGNLRESKEGLLPDVLSDVLSEVLSEVD